MLVRDLFQKVLIEPAKEGASQLLIVSGYATASMVDRHLRCLDEVIDAELNIRLIYGMASVDGVSRTDDFMFRELESNSTFGCFYFAESYPVHSKVYVWLSDNEPYRAYVGSANYTQGGFLSEYDFREVMAEVDPHKALEYYNTILQDSLEIRHDDIYKRVRILNPVYQSAQEKVDYVDLSFLSRGIVPERSGLNWGQRPEAKRRPNEAYIPVPQTVAQSRFFPKRAVQFTVLTDDNFSFIGTVAQDNDKAIHSTEDNEIIGKYFRKRLEVESGERVVKEDLDRYGRTDVRFWKIDDETFYLDFSI